MHYTKQIDLLAIKNENGFFKEIKFLKTQLITVNFLL